jgi:AcrR family transcriptional regulator
MRRTFFNLTPENRERLLEICAREFAAKGYELASTNTIARRAGIAKGSFFKYFGSKESVYLHLVTGILRDLGEIQASPAAYPSKDLVVRAGELFARHMEYARRSPVRYRLALRALLETHSPLYAKVAAIRDGISKRTAGKMYAGVDWEMYRYPRADVVEFLECLDLGLRQAALQALGKKTGIRSYEACVSRKLAMARRILSSGLYKATPSSEESA